MPGQFDISPVENATIINYSGGNQDVSGRAILIGTAGNLAVDMVGTGTNVILPLPVGLHAIRIKRIYQTGSTAAGVVMW